MREKLAGEIDTCPFSSLEPHLAQSNAFVVGDDLDFLDVAEALANDHVDKVKQWVESGSLVRPTPEMIATWSGAPDRSFRMVIVKPFLLIQPVAAS